MQKGSLINIEQQAACYRSPQSDLRGSDVTEMDICSRGDTSTGPWVRRQGDSSGDSDESNSSNEGSITNSDDDEEIEGQFDIDPMTQDEAIIAAVRVTRDGEGMGAGHVPPE